MLTRTFRLWPVLLASLALMAPAQALPPAQIKERPAPKVRIERYQLDNGLRVILSPDKVAPVVSVTLMYDVGSRNEEKGLTGFAHLFEHLMFQGSENVGKGEHFTLISENGGSFNGTTSQDRTVYYATMPANQLDLALFLEADRMRALDVTQENLDNQREVVKEERRQRVDNQPYGSLYEESLRTFFNSFAYQHSVIGSMDDLNSATVDDAQRFFKTYYTPNNAVLVLVGDFQVSEAKKKIQKYFGPIPRGPNPPPLNADEPAIQGEKRANITDPHATLPRLRRYYRAVPGNHPDFYALQVAGVVLSGRGKTGRLYQRFVEPRLALGTSAAMLEMRTLSPFQIELSLPANANIDRVEETLDREIERLKEQPITAEEMNRAQVQLRTSFVSRLQKTQDKGLFLATYTLNYNDPNRINTLYSRQAKVTPTDVQRVARKYFHKQNSATLIVIPGKATQPSTASGTATENNV